MHHGANEYAPRLFIASSGLALTFFHCILGCNCRVHLLVGSELHSLLGLDLVFSDVHVIVIGSGCSVATELLTMCQQIFFGVVVGL